MPNPIRNLFSLDSLPAHLLRIACVIITVMIAKAAYSTYQEYSEAQGILSIVQAEADGAVVEGDGIETVNFTPQWLVFAQITASILAGAGAVIALIFAQGKWGQVFSVSLACFAIALFWAPSSLVENLPSLGISKVGENPSSMAYFLELALVIFLILSPPIMMWAYHTAPILDRYLLQAVITPFALSFCGILSIWIIMDLTDNGQSFITSGAGLSLLGHYYVVQLPQIILMVMPVTLLLSLLYGLNKMSRSNELISMLGSGLSLGRVLKPLLIVGLYFSVVGVVLKYEWAPNSEARKIGILNRLNDITKDDDESSQEEEWAANGWMYRNGIEGRSWFVGRVPVNLATSPMRYVAVWMQGPDGQIKTAYRADSVTWDYRTKVWTMRKCKIFEYNDWGAPKIIELPVHTIPNWRETPWHVVSSSYEAELLGIPGLTNYLRSNQAVGDAKLAAYRTHWHYSWAEPLRCILIVLMAAPLGIVHGRRGGLGGVAACMMIFFALIFFDSFFLSLGKTGRIPAWIGAWGPNIFLLLIGVYLFYIRSVGKEVPKLSQLLSRKKA